jgi:hypothetical protein
MTKRLLFLVALCGDLAAASAPAFAQQLVAQLFPLTGEIRLLNRDATPVPFVYYSISSDASALNGASGIWQSITQNYDRPAGATPGNGFIDPNGDWIKLSSVSTELTEGSLDADGGRLLATRAVSLGNIWDPQATPFPDLVFDIRDDSLVIPVSIELALDGDYSMNQIVDSADYVVWRHFLNSMTAYFADGDLDGIVDMDDYVVWEENFGLTLPLPPYGAGSGGGSPGLSGDGAGVPEPMTAVLILLAAGLLHLIVRVPRAHRLVRAPVALPQYKAP